MEIRDYKSPFCTTGWTGIDQYTVNPDFLIVSREPVDPGMIAFLQSCSEENQVMDNLLGRSVVNDCCDMRWMMRYIGSQENTLAAIVRSFFEED